MRQHTATKNMASVSYQISNLLEKMTSSDKDFRFMATNDLMTELQKDSIKLDDDSERKVVKMLLRLLEDKNGEVQNLAVRCLGPLVTKVKEYQVETIVDSLCLNMVSGNEQLRDISSIGLKTVISELPNASSALAANVCKRVTGKLSCAIEKQDDVSVQLETLDILSDLLSRFGVLLVAFHSTILTALLPQLASQRQAVRKRSIVALSHLVMSCNQVLYSKLIDFLLDGLNRDFQLINRRTYVQCIASICRQAGHRFGEHIERVMPLIVKFSKQEDGELDDELTEFCLQAFEAFIQRCPKEVTPHVHKIVALSLEFIEHDPNYNYDDGDDSDGLMETEETDDDDNDEYSDDDDMSWKVRRSAAKCLEATINTRIELVVEFYKSVSPALIKRFKEREENVKSDVFHAYMALLKQTSKQMASVPVHRDADSMDEEGVAFYLHGQIPTLVPAIQALMKEKSIKTRQDCFMLLRELILVSPGALAAHMPGLIPGIQYSLGDKNSSSNMKIDTLAFINCLLATHQPAVFHPHMAQLVPPVVTAVKDTFYKITAEGLLVLQQLVKVIRPLDSSSDFDFTPYTCELYHCTLLRLKASDIDQEVKERAISCMGQILCHFGDYLKGEMDTCMPIFLGRLRNEITRLTTVKALTKVAASPLKIDLRLILDEAIPILSTFLRKNQRSLKLSTLTLLDTLVSNYRDAMNTVLLSKVTAELAPLLNESDLHIAQVTLTLLTSIAQVKPAALANINRDILPEILVLVKSPLLQGSALNSLLEFFQALVGIGLHGLGFHELLNMLTAPFQTSFRVNARQSTGDAHVSPPIKQPQQLNASNRRHSAEVSSQLHKQAYHSLARCVAAITITCQQHSLLVIHKFLQGAQSPYSDTQHIFSLLVIGEIGRHIDLSKIPEVKDVIMHTFTVTSEELKSAASYALGSVAMGNLPVYLPIILEEIENIPRRQYLLLHSLKEIISWQSSTPEGIKDLQTFVPSIWIELFRHCECAEEGTRNVVAECLGKLTLIDPPLLLPLLEQSLNSHSALMRTTVVTAVKFTISDQPQPIDRLLRTSFRTFLERMQDPDLNVRRVALVAFNSAAHNKPSLVRDMLENLQPRLYAETRVRKELIREVEMGPFKHTVDDGLDIRKAAFECMYTLLDTCLDRIDIFEFLNQVENGLKDHYDIKMLTYLMVARLAQLCPSPVLQRLERLVEPLRITCTTKVKANSVKQEYEKQDELKRSAMRAVTALLTIPDAEKNPHLCEFLTQIKGTLDLQVIYDSVQKDTHSMSSDSSLNMDMS